MNFDYSDKTKELQTNLQAFIYPNEKVYHDEINSGDRCQQLQLIAECQRELGHKTSLKSAN